MFRFVTLLLFVAACSAASIGEREQRPPSRIVGGTATTIDQRPFQVLVMDGPSLYCGGIILGRHTVMTAAHCCGMAASRYNLRIGSTNRSSGGQVVQVRSIDRHSGYNSQTIDNDICMLYTVQTINYSNNAQPATIPPANFNIPADAAFDVSGWGALAVSFVSALIITL